MANKSFEIQESKLRLGGVDLEAGAGGGVVIPGVTQASNYRVEEVDDRGDQTYQFTPDSEVVVIDAALYDAIFNELADDHFADYTAPTDDEGYIDEIEVNSRGTYTQQEANTAGIANMYAYVGNASASDRPLVPEDWIQIPFRPKMRAGAVENVGGGGNANTGDVTFDGQTIIGDGSLYLAPSPDDFDNEKYLRVRTGDQDSHLHFDTSDNSNYDLYLGDDSKYVRIAKTGEIVLGVNDAYEWNTESGSRWTFNTTGGLTFPDGTTQTTAYTGQSGGGGTGLTYYVMANDDGNVVTSTDGVSWSSPVDIAPGGISHVATDGNNIVFIDGSTVGFTSFTEPSTATERTAAVDGMTNVNLNQITYGGGYFVVAGDCDNGTLVWPLYGYSTDGDSWTFKVITDGALQATLANNNNEASSFSDVDYNGSGFNFAVSGSSVGGGVYTTDITETFTETNYFSMVPGLQVAWNGDAWYYFNDSQGSGINTNTDPRTGSFDGPFDPWGTSNLDVGYMLGGETSDTFCGGDGVLAVSDGSGHITYSTNNGADWTVVTPIPYTTTAFNVSQQNAAVITFTNMVQQPGTAPASVITESPSYNNEKVVITDAGEYNGTYYVNFIADNAFTLCTDQGLTTPLDSSGFAAFSSGTVTFSHGMYIDAIDYANGYFYMGNDNDQIARARSTNMGSWVIVDDQNNAFEFWNDFFGYTDVALAGNSLTNNGYTFTLNADGTITLPDGSQQTTSLEPQLTKVDDKVRLTGTLEMGPNPGGSVSTFDSDRSTGVWFNASTGDPSGNKYAVGSDNNGNSFLISYNPDGSLRWKYRFGNIEYDGNTFQIYPYSIKHITGPGPELIYVGFDFANATGTVTFAPDGSILNNSTWLVSTGGENSLDHRDLVVNPTDGQPFIAGSAYGEWVAFNNTPVDQNLLEEDGILSIARSDMNNIVSIDNGDTGNWNIDIDGTSNWYQPGSINQFRSVPATTVTGVGGYRQLNGGNSSSWSYLDGALTVDNSGANPILTITAANWYATADLNAILNHGIGQTYNLTLNVSDGYTFQTTGSWTETDPGVSGVWTVEGTLTPLSGGPISTAVNVNVLTYGSNVLLDVYYYIDNNGVSYYDYANVNTMGTGYVQGDQIKVRGSYLGGINSVTLTGTAHVSTSVNNLFFAADSYPGFSVVENGWRASGPGIDGWVTLSNVQLAGALWRFDVPDGVTVQAGETYTIDNNGNDLTLDYYVDWNNLNIVSGTPIQNIARFRMDQTVTPALTFNLRQSTDYQAFIISNDWSVTMGDTNSQRFESISLDHVDSILYATGDFNVPNQNDYPIFAFNSANGNILWQKTFDDGTGYTNDVYVAADSVDNNVYVTFQNDDGQASLMKLDSSGSLVWAVRLQNNNWGYYPRCVVDSNGDPILVGTYGIYNPSYDNWANEIFISKLSKTDGSQVWAKTIGRNISQRNNIYFNYDIDNNWVNIDNDIIYVAGYTYDAYNDYYVGVSVAVPADGSLVGEYEGWNYTEFTDLGVDTVTNDITFDTTTYAAVNELTITPGEITFGMDTDQPGWLTYSTAIGGGSKVVFEDGSEQATAGIARFSKDAGNTSRTLSASMNGKFLYYDNSNNSNNSWIYIPANADVALPVGYTVTVVVANMNGYSIYVNNDGNSDVVIYHAGSSDGVNNYWMFSSNGIPGVYTIMKVDTNTWMLAGPDISVD